MDKQHVALRCVGVRVCILYPILLHLHQNFLVLLSDGQSGAVDPLVDLLALAGLKCVEALTTVAHPVQHKHISYNCFRNYNFINSIIKQTGKYTNTTNGQITD